MENSAGPGSGSRAAGPSIAVLDANHIIDLRRRHLDAHPIDLHRRHWEVGGGLTSAAASHELIEAATDPHVGSQSTIAYYMTNLAWSIEGGEVGDVCVGRNDEYQESGFAVQRSWSNTAAKASHDPCVPAPANEAYFNTAYASNSLASMKVGDTKTIQLTAFSDAPTDDWALRATDYAQQYGGTASLDIQLDKATANNGTKINMTVKVVAAPPKNFGGYALFSISSKNATGSHRWPGAILIH